MQIEQIIVVPGRNAFAHKDLAAIKAGARPNGFLFDGPPVTPGFDRIVQPGGVLSVLLLLEGGAVAHGDCVDVIFAGAAGRDPVFRPEDHAQTVLSEIAPALIGRDTADYATNIAAVEALRSGGRAFHTALRYGISQALIHAAALGAGLTVTEVVAGAKGVRPATERIPILVSVPKTDWTLLDRMILKEADILPHASFTHVGNDLGQDGHMLVEFAGALSRRIAEISRPEYRPRIHLDTYGTLGELFDNDIGRIGAFIGKVAEAAAPYELLIESPIIARSRAEQIELYAMLRARMREAGVPVRVIVDEWCNTLDDIRAFGAAGAADAVQIKAPDLGSLTESIDAVLYCREIGLGCCLGGTANETDQSARLTAQIALATRPEFILGKPGLGGDEALMILNNEMSRTLALIAARKPAGATKPQETP